MFKVNNRNTRTRCEICSKLTIKTPERPQWRRSGAFIVSFGHVLTQCSSVSIVNFEHVNVGWVLYWVKRSYCNPLIVFDRIVTLN